MKTKVVLLLITFFIGLNITHAENYRVMISQKVKKEITYPEFAIKEGLQGDVLIAFKITEQGNFEVFQANSADANLKHYVVNTIENLKIPKELAITNEHFYMKFRFTLK